MAADRIRRRLPDAAACDQDMRLTKTEHVLTIRTIRPKNQDQPVLTIRTRKAKTPQLGPKNQDLQGQKEGGIRPKNQDTYSYQVGSGLEEKHQQPLKARAYQRYSPAMGTVPTDIDAVADELRAREAPQPETGLAAALDRLGAGIREPVTPDGEVHWSHVDWHGSTPLTAASSETLRAQRWRQ